MVGWRRAIRIWITLLAVACPAWGAWEKPIAPESAIPTLETALQLVAEQAQAATESAMATLKELRVDVRDGRVVVVVEGEGLSRMQVEALGGEVIRAAEHLGLWEVAVPGNELVSLARLPGVRFVRRPYTPVPLVVSQGVRLSGANAWHAAGFGGQGIRIAVIDLEFGGLSAALSSGELTHVVYAHDYTGWGLETGGPHGTACAEIVQDMAPQAELILMKVDTEVQFALAVADAVGLGARVITHSVGWFNTNFYDGTGVVCGIVRSATDRGVLWVNAAGNSADGAHWEGTWHDRDGDDLLDFALGMNVNSFTVEAGVPTMVWLTWDGWPTTDQDYDLYLVQMPTGLVVASSTNNQTGTQPPTEQVFYVPPFPGTYGIVIRGYNVPRQPRLEVFCTSQVKLSHPVAPSSIPAPGNAGFVLTVGAIAWSTWTTGPQEPFSSQGPTNVSRLNSVSITKPDICGPDRVDTRSYGASAFAGTSAAAPHVAGGAAVLWAARPTWSAAEVRAWLEGNAVDMGVAGKDNIYGSGRLDLPAAELPGPGPVVEIYWFPAGWNLVAIPLKPANPDPAAVFGDDVSPLYMHRWNPAARVYDVPTAIAPAHGYWLRVPAGGTTVDVEGTKVTTDVSVSLPNAGWQMISAPWGYPRAEIRFSRGTETRDWADAVTAGWIADALWGYTPVTGYAPTTSIDPWQGYWLLTRVGGLTMHLLYASRTTSTIPELAPMVAPAGAATPPPPPDAGAKPVGKLEVVNVPNPITDIHTTTFKVVGPLAALVTEIRVRIYDLGGRLVWQASAGGAALDWHTDDLAGRYLANGVYLYQAQVKVAGAWVTTELKKLAIYR